MAFAKTTEVLYKDELYSTITTHIAKARVGSESERVITEESNDGQYCYTQLKVFIWYALDHASHAPQQQARVHC